MVALNTVRASNALLKESTKGLVALFLGATSGIGRASVKQFVAQADSPRVYIVARNAAAAQPLLEELRLKNPNAQCEIIEKDVSLLKDATAVTEIVKAKETKLDLLFLSVGFFSFDGRHDTAEGLDASMTTRYYSRLRVIQLLLPLLNASSSPHVTNILAAGLEGPICETDLSLKDPGRFSVSSSNSHTATMLTLSLERLARENPQISFVHTFPGLVATPLLGRTTEGKILGPIIRLIGVPLVGLVGTTPDEAGEKAIFYATSTRYSVNDGLVPLVEGIQRASRDKGGVFLVDAKGESADNEKVLDDFRKRDVDKLIWEHTMEVFKANP